MATPSPVAQPGGTPNGVAPPGIQPRISTQAPAGTPGGISTIPSFSLGSGVAVGCNPGSRTVVVYPHQPVVTVLAYQDHRLHPLYLHLPVGAFHLERLRYLVVLIILLRLLELLNVKRSTLLGLLNVKRQQH